MSETYISTALRRLVEERAWEQCEYCLLSSGVSFYPHEVDHIIAEKHGGLTESDNLAYACARCNRFKGTDLGSFDPATGQFAFLFNPRTQVWGEHFAFESEMIVGLTAEGRTTVKLLQMNSDECLAERRSE
ncbi:MAG: HNH endonuclease [Acidobacteria bacterium]|nr:HNH endonuclease [Acidobacteriota bacterium]